MKTTPQSISEPRAASNRRASTVMMGRQDYASVQVRLIGMELYKLRRRLMSKVLGSIAILTTIGLFAIVTGVAFYLTRNGSAPDVIQGYTTALRLPDSLSMVVQVLNILGEVLLIILVSTIVGGEYSDKTVRLMLTRGPSRTQFLFAKVGASAICILLGVFGLTLLGVIVGQLLNLSTGIVQSFSFLTFEWLGHVLLYLLITALGLFLYAMMALCLSTLGRTTAAGIAGVLTWSFVVEPVIEVSSNFGRVIGGPIGDFFQSLPDYLIGPNISQLQQDQSHFIFASAINSPTSLQADVHGLLVLAVYLVILIGLAWWVTLRRDVVI